MPARRLPAVLAVAAAVVTVAAGGGTAAGASAPAGATPAATVPLHGVLVPGASLGGVRLGMTAARVCELVRRLRETSETPIIFYTYYNLLFANGVDAYVRAAKAAGVDGILTLDLPPEESGDVTAACRTHGVDTVFIIAPTTPDARIPTIAAATTGFIYYVSREGVTGVREQVAGNIAEAVARIRTHTALPVAVGFGIGSRAQVAQVAALADGVVVGSALVNCVRDHLGDRAKIVAALAAKAADLAAGVTRS